MTLGKAIYTLLCFSALFCFSACNHSNEDIAIGDDGYHVVFRHVSPDTLTILKNVHEEQNTDDACASLLLYVESTLAETPEQATPQKRYLEGVKSIEQQLTSYFESMGDWLIHGDVPVFVEYTTVVCQSIRITLYNQEHTLIEDITEQAEFRHIGNAGDPVEEGYVINADGKLTGKILSGTTIKDYLALRPMIFTLAHLQFPHIPKDVIANGNYVKVEIELQNGHTLITTS